VFQVKDIMIG